MVTDLKLGGNELVVFAFVHGFCQSSGNGWKGNLDTLAAHTGMSKSTAQRTLKALVEKKFIQKVESVTTYCKDGNQYRNTLPLYITIDSEAAKESSLTETESHPVEKEPEKERKQTSKKKPHENSQYAAAKEAFMEARRFGREGATHYVYAEQCCINSALINKRLKDLFDRGVTVAQMRATFFEMLNDSFCVNQLGFELAPLLSETVFFKAYNAAAAKYLKKKMAQKPDQSCRDLLRPVSRCKCGQVLTPAGLCPVCDIDEIIENMR
jgi:hypothetical protein